MKTHTVRKKLSNRPIYTLTPAFLARVKRSHPGAVRLTLSVFKHHYKVLTGKEPVLDFNQSIELEDVLDADIRDRQLSESLTADEYIMKQAFERGMQQGLSVMTMEKVLDVGQAFYEMLEQSVASRVSREAT